MAKKKDGITDLTKLLVTVSRNGLRLMQYQEGLDLELSFALLNGVNYGYTDTLGPRFLQDCCKIYMTVHNTQILLKVGD